jgi:AcrR family transcriptional regulator
LVAEDLLDAALLEFATHGFDGASTREVARKAGWHQPQINYHFASKEALWKAAVDKLFAELTVETEELFSAPPADLPGAFAKGIRSFVAFSARRPELFRIMSLESTADSDRLDWIVERHIRPRFEITCAAWERLRATGAGADIDGVTAYQLIVGFGSVPFANAPALQRLTGADATTPQRAAKHAEALIALLLPARNVAPSRNVGSLS